MLIRTRFYLVTIITILLGVSGTALLNYALFKREIVSTLNSKETSVVREIKNEIKRRVFDVFQRVQLIRTHSSTVDYLAGDPKGRDYQATRNMLFGIQALLPNASSITIVNSSGLVLISSNYNTSFLGNIADRDYFSEAMKGYLRTAFEPRPDDPSKYNFIIAAPVRTNDSVVGAVMVTVSMHELIDIPTMNSFGYSGDNALFLVDQDGAVILREGNKARDVSICQHNLLYPEARFGDAGMRDEEDLLIFFTSLPRIGLELVSYAPRASLYRSLYTFRNTNIIVHLVILLIAVICAKILANSVIPRLRQGMDFARAVVAGDISGRLETSDDEFGTMFGAFNIMISHLKEALDKAGRMERRASAANDALAAQNSRLESLVAKRTEELQKANEHASLILNMADEAILELDGDMRINFMNSRTLEMLGYTEEELRGGDFFSAVRHCHMGGVVCDDIDCALRRAAGGNEETRLHNILIMDREDGVIPVSISVMPEGAPPSHHGAIIAIIDQSEISRTFQELQNSSPTAIITVRDGIALKINDKGYDMLGLRPGDRMERVYVDLEQRSQMLSSLALDKPVRDCPIQLYGANGRRMDTLITIYPFLYEGMYTLLVWVSDVTALTQAKIMAERAARARTVFLASMSHEIRTPLNAIMGLSEAELRNELADGTRSNIEKIYSSGSTLLGIINDILDMSKIDSGKFEIVPAEYDFTNMMSDTIQQNIVRIASKSIKFETTIDEDTPMRFFGDEIRIRQILNNLLSNAFKYTNEGTVTLDVTCERNGDDAWLAFVVRDTGIGIKEEDIPNLFVEYRQFDRAKNLRVGGTGLGLSICKNLVDMMGGELGVESEYGVGSTFTARIPQKITNPDPIGSHTANNLRTFRLMKHQASKNFARTPMPFGKALVVDDVTTNLDVAKALMSPYELTVHCVTTGMQAIEAIRSEQPRYDIIFMDHMMPEMDGIETVRAIRNDIGTEYARDVPIIALTANAIMGNEDLFLKNGFNAFISKPIDVKKLDRILTQWIQKETDGNNLPEEDPPSLSCEKPGWSMEGVDVEKGFARFDGEKIYLELLSSFAKHTPPLLAGLSNVSAESLSEYATAVHGIKGAAHGIMATTLAGMAEELERAAKRGDLETVLNYNCEFILAAKKLISDIQAVAISRSNDGADSKETRDAPDRGMLARLFEQCGQFDFGNMDRTLRELENFVYEREGDLVSWLREKIDNLDYNDISERLRTVLDGAEIAADDPA